MLDTRGGYEAHSKLRWQGPVKRFYAKRRPEGVGPGERAFSRRLRPRQRSSSSADGQAAYCLNCFLGRESGCGALCENQAIERAGKEHVAHLRVELHSAEP